MAKFGVVKGGTHQLTGGNINLCKKRKRITKIVTYNGTKITHKNEPVTFTMEY